MSSDKGKPGDSVGDLSNSGFIGAGEEILATGKGYTIEWFHVPTGRVVKFKAMLTSYSDSFGANWNSEEVYGRMDAMQTFSSTTRQINIGWSMPASSIEEARQNMEKFALLASMLYPSYDVNMDAKFGGATSIAAAPLFKLKVVNLVSSGQGGVQEAGLLGTCEGFDFAPDLDIGFFDSPGELLPKMFELGCTFTVIHQHPLGWTNEGENSQWRSKAGKDGEGNPKADPNLDWLYNQRMAGDHRTPAAAGGTEEKVQQASEEVLNNYTSGLWGSE